MSALNALRRPDPVQNNLISGSGPSSETQPQPQEEPSDGGSISMPSRTSGAAGADPVVDISDINSLNDEAGGERKATATKAKAAGRGIKASKRAFGVKASGASGPGQGSVDASLGSFAAPPRAAGAGGVAGGAFPSRTGSKTAGLKRGASGLATGIMGSLRGLKNKIKGSGDGPGAGGGKYEMSGELQAEFEKARKHQKSLVKETIAEKKQREREQAQAARQAGAVASVFGASGRSADGVQAYTADGTQSHDVNDPRFADFLTDDRLEELIQYAIYLGVDLDTQPELVHTVRDLYYAPLPEGYSAHRTSADCEFGGGLMYYSYKLTDAQGNQTTQTTWSHPREDYHVMVLAGKVNTVVADSKIWHARQEAKQRSEIRKRFSA